MRIPEVPSIARERIDGRLATLWQRRLGVVVAPAGSGKTTLLAGFAARAGVPVAWYRAETRDGREADLLRYLEAAFARAIPDIGRGWAHVEDGVNALDAAAQRPHAPRMLLVVDDLHTLEATPAEAALERLVEYAPPQLAILAGARVPPRFNLSRLRVSGGLVELTADDVRFRSWEVERLFRDFYGESLGPEELATLARRTGGWAAGLALFHLATSGASREERRRVLAGMSTNARLLGEYLTRNVLDQLPAELHRFLIETAVLPILSGRLCDAFLGRQGSGALLADLARRQVFTTTIDDEGTFRYHEVLRTTLQMLFAARHGEAALHDAHRRAAELLEGAHLVPEALTAYGRAGAWGDAERLLRESGRDLADGPEQHWLDSIPASLLRHDPWLVLATARRHRAEGRWTAALEAYRRAEAAFGVGDAGARCRRERLALGVWLDEQPARSADWWSRLRFAVVRDPLGAARGDGPRPIDDLHGRLAEGISLLVAGRVRDARARLAAVADDAEEPRAIADPPRPPDLTVVAAGRLCAGVAGLLGGDPRARGDLQAAVGAAERGGLGWLSRLASAVLTLSDGAVTGADAATLRAAFERDGDAWTSPLLGLLSAWLDPTDAALSGLANRVATAFRELGAGALEAWARGLLAVGHAQAGDDALEAMRAADVAGRSSMTPGVGLLVERALADAGAEGSASHRSMAEAMAEETGLAVQAGGRGAVVVVKARERDGPPTGDVRITCFGGFVIEVDDRRIALDAVKPRARAILHLLAANAGTAVHREVIQGAFWPDAPNATAARLLQVAISSLRGALEPALGVAGGRLIARDGDAYRLAVPDGATVDVREFSGAIAAARQARARGSDGQAGDAFATALGWYGGDLLPEDGPAEWVVEARDRHRLAAVDAAQQLAELRLATGDAAAAVAACAVGLRLDRFHDPLWRLLIDGHDAAGDRGAASQARQRYDRMLAELGVATGAGFR